MHKTAAESCRAWLVPVFLTALVGFGVYGATVADSVSHDVGARQPEVIRYERLATEFVGALRSWSRDVRKQASGGGVPAMGNEVTRTDLTASMQLQASLRESPLENDSVRLLRRVIEDRAEASAARDLVVQLRLAGEAQRADRDAEGVLEVAISRMLQHADSLQVELRRTADSMTRSQEQDAQRVARAFQVSSVLGVAALGLSLFSLRMARGNVTGEVFPLSRPEQSAAALAAQGVLQKMLGSDAAAGLHHPRTIKASTARAADSLSG